MSTITTEQQACKCNLRTRLVGDGCEVCNPELAAELAQQPEPVLVVEKEPDYWSGGHFHQGSKSHIDPTKVWNLPIGTKLYTDPPQPEPAQEPVAVYQWRKQGCADWYDGHPDYSDCGGPYETRILYTAPPQRPPLTDEEILSVLRLAPPEPSLWPHLKDEAVVGDVQRAVLAIARAVEQAHGIKE